MKNIFAVLFLTSIFYSECFALGKKDNDVPSENVEYAISGEEIPDPEKLEPLYELRKPEGDKIGLKESWGYVMKARKDEYNPDMPLTDVCYFAAEINQYGELVGVPSRSSLNVGKARCHLVVICESKSLTHLVLEPKFGVRNKLIREIAKAGAQYDGVQIDFELVPPRDRKNFIYFLSDLRYSLGKNQWFSVCVPARFKLLTEDVYPYEEIARYCDRVFVMAYDEHWSTSKPGPIASIDWCRKVAEYAKKSIPEKKLIMGIPFYGRTWASETTAGAWYFSGATRIMTEHRVPEVNYEDDIPTFKYTAQVDITGYFNDLYSCVQLCRMYDEFGIRKIGYWRIGMEDPEFWNWIEIRK